MSWITIILGLPTKDFELGAVLQRFIWFVSTFRSLIQLADMKEFFREIKKELGTSEVLGIAYLLKDSLPGKSFN